MLNYAGDDTRVNASIRVTIFSFGAVTVDLLGLFQTESLRALLTILFVLAYRSDRECPLDGANLLTYILEIKTCRRGRQSNGPESIHRRIPRHCVSVTNECQHYFGISVFLSRAIWHTPI